MEAKTQTMAPLGFYLTHNQMDAFGEPKDPGPTHGGGLGSRRSPAASFFFGLGGARKGEVGEPPFA